MKKIAVMTQKGGSGKTTLAVHLAVAMSLGTARIALLDTDPQASAAEWARGRYVKTGPTVGKVPPEELDDALFAAEEGGFDVGIVDTAPHAEPSAVRIAKVVDFILIPVRPSAFDLAAARNSSAIATAAKCPAAFVLSACPQRAPEISAARRALEGYGLPVLDSEISERRAFSRAISSCQGVSEFEPKGRAALEIRQLLRELVQIAKLPHHVAIEHKNVEETDG